MENISEREHLKINYSKKYIDLYMYNQMSVMIANSIGIIPTILNSSIHIQTRNFL